jgi:hypothetical protein
MFYMLTTINMITLRNLRVLSTVMGMFLSKLCREWITKFHNYLFVVHANFTIGIETFEVKLISSVLPRADY